MSILIELNEIEKEAIMAVLKTITPSFNESQYCDVVEAYPSGEMPTIYLPTKAHIKALKSVRNKITNN